ncbi:MAG: DnaD domain protein [Ruminococcaceae bacterium]|nr:DnaD domain protein [Oscillospiraceae bacterium]
MIFEALSMPAADVRRLLSAASPDAALLYIYLKSENSLEQAGEDLRLNESRISCAAAVLRQLGLWTDEKPARVLAGERPSYSERDVLEAMDGDNDFRALYGEIQRQLGRSLNTEELKILLGFVRYLGMSPEVISILVSFCRDRARQKGSSRNPSLRTIEKEAYAWAERGIDSVEEAAAYIQTQNVRHSRLGRLMQILQIRGRNLTAAEERYASSWLDMGFEESAILEAYERTCLNTGGMNWAYMNKILQRWHASGLHTAEAVKNSDQKNPGSGKQRQLDEDEIAAIQRMMQEA